MECNIHILKKKHPLLASARSLSQGAVFNLKDELCEILADLCSLGRIARETAEDIAGSVG